MTKHNIDSNMLRLADIMQAIADIESIRLDEKSERKELLACAYAIAIIGEASNQLTQEVRQAYAQIPWRNIIDMRNRIIHEYGSLSQARLLAVIREDIPVLKRQLEAILLEWKDK